MTSKQRATLRTALQQLRAQALKAGPARIEPNRTAEAQAGVVDEDAQALSEMLQTLSSQRNKGQAELISRIDRALRRLEQAPDEFGLCQECEEAIPFRRLELLPYAELCAGCQTNRDPKRGTGRRKITDYQ